MRAHPTREHLDWPFFEPAHRAYAERLDRFVAGGAIDDVDHHDIDGACRKLVARLGEAGLLDIAIVDATGDSRSILSRLVCLTRETLAWHDGLADFAFAMQGLGAGAIGLAGSPELQAVVLPMIRAGEWVAAFALSEEEAGSDVAAMSCTARAEGSDWPTGAEIPSEKFAGAMRKKSVSAAPHEGLATLLPMPPIGSGGKGP